MPTPIRTALTATLAVAGGLVALPTLAHAEDAAPGINAEPSSGYAIGVRVGGYGFRRDDGDRRSAWDECRMNGVGVFGDRSLGRVLFVEAGLDGYFSESWPQPNSADDLPIDRVSGLVTGAIGVRSTVLTDRIVAYAQLGAGIELTQVSVPYGDASLQDRMILPEGFLGAGGDLHIAGGFSVGANLRFHVMGNFDYDPAKLEMQDGWTTPPSADDVFAPEPDVSAQAQFYVRRAL